jgi:plasmid stabilization system protein ParE
MKYRVVLSPEGRKTIDEQADWYCSDEQQGGEELATRWLDELQAALASLAVMPGRHGLAPENGKWHPDVLVRQMLFRPWQSGVGWRVLFAVDEPTRIVSILQIRHERRRWLFEPETREE